MVEAASRSTLSGKDQNLLAVFGSEHVHMAMVCRDDLCEKAQVSLVVHGSERVRGLPMSAFAALVHGSRRVRDNAMAYAAMQPDVDADVLHLAAMWG